jgi:hypothetical protein
MRSVADCLVFSSCRTSAALSYFDRLSRSVVKARTFPRAMSESLHWKPKIRTRRNIFAPVSPTDVRLFPAMLDSPPAYRLRQKSAFAQVSRCRRLGRLVRFNTKLLADAGTRRLRLAPS